MGQAEERAELGPSGSRTAAPHLDRVDALTRFPVKAYLGRQLRARSTPLTTTPHPTHHEPGVHSTHPSTRRLVRSGALAGAIAAVCTTVVAAVAHAADVSLDVDATAIPIPAFAWWTIVGAALGVVMARLLRERRRFVVVASVAAGLSLIPPIAVPDDTATKAVLVGAHLLAAAIIIPTISQRLTAVSNDRSLGN